MDGSLAPRNLTQLLVQWRNGDRAALDEMTPVVYEELRRLARHFLAAERSDHTLQPTALVHEAYLRLVDQHAVDWRNRAHFLAMAATMMRRILINYAEAHKAAKREGSVQMVTLDEAFGMHTLFAAHKNVQGLGPLYTPFDEVLETADVITLHCPLMPTTRNMIAAPEFAKMKKRPLLINCGRGGLVNEADLVDALDRGQIAGVGFDCLASEPPSSDNPLLRIVDRPNVIVTPHVAWASDEAMQTLWNQVISHIENFHAGRPSNQVA